MKSIAKSTKVTALKVFSVFMAIVLVVTLSPWGAFGTGDDSDTPADTTVATTPEGEEETTLSTTNASEDKTTGETQSTGQSTEQTQSASQSSNQSSGQSQATGQTTEQTEEQAKVRLNLDLAGGNAYMVYTSDEEGEQKIVYPATYVDLPEGKDFTFQAKAANGYVLEAVWFSIGQDEEELTPNEDGTYTVPAADLTDGCAIEIEVLSAEEAEQLGLLSDEPSVASENGTNITINVNFRDANGNETSESSLGKSLYAFVYAGTTINSVSQRIMVKLAQSGSSYTATLTGILDNNGNKQNNGTYYPFEANTDYHVILLATSGTYNENQYWDSNGENNSWWTVLKDSSLLKSLYTIDVPDSDIVKVGGTYTATATAFGEAGSDSLETILTGNTKYFGIITEHFTGDGDAETNVAAKLASCTYQTGNDLTNPVAQTFILAKLDNVFKIKGEAAYVYVPESDASRITHETPSKLTLDTKYSEETLSSWVGQMLQVGSNASSRLADVEDNAAIEKDKSDKAKWMVDLTSRGAGTYYVTLDADTFKKVFGSADMLRIYKNNDQTIVFNVTAGDSLSMNKFSVNGSGTDTYTNKSDTSSDTASSIVWNFVNATAVTFDGAATGIFLAPNASVSTAVTCSGWLVAKQVTINTGEWHNVYQHMVELGSSTSLQAAKTVDGEVATVNGFEFQLLQQDASGEWKAIQTVQNTGGTVQFDAITYDGSDFAPSDTSKDYIYKMVEVGSDGATTIGGTSYTTDSAVYYAKVTVTKKTTSENNTTTTVYSAGNPTYYSDEACTQLISGTVPTFANTTNKEDSASVTISGTKTIEGRNFQSGDSITFTLTDSSEKVLDTQIITPASGTSASVSFKELSYTKNDLGGKDSQTFEYTVTETANMKGVSKKSKEQKVTVTLAKDKTTGKLVATASQTKENSGVAFAFTNTYSATGSLTLTGTKTLEGQTLGEKNVNQFTYSVYEGENEVVSSGTTDANGKITFSDILYMLNQTGEHTYTVTEDIPTGAELQSNGLWKNGCYLYDGTNYTVTVNVSDNGDGTLKAEITSVKNGDTEVANKAISFANKYEAAGSVVLNVKKELTGKVLEAGAFSFELKDGNEVLQTKSNDAKGLVTFDPISYTKAGTYTYTITEKIPDGAKADNNYTVDGITYDPKIISVTVEVTDKGNGVFEAVPTYSVNGVAQGATTFTNTYDASGSITLTGSKKLVADTESSDPVQLKLTDTYNFAVYDANGNEVATGTNDRDGKISFTAIKYGLDDLGDLGDHKYTVKETSASTDTVTIDTTVQTITVRVTDNGDGTLAAKAVDGNGTEITDVASVLSFSNKRKVEDTEATIQVQKALDGCSWSDIAKAGVSNFEFKLTAQNGAPMPTDTTDTDSDTATAYASSTNSTASFGAIKYNKAGTYNYTITEVVPEGATEVDGVPTYNGITYDTSQTTVTVTVENVVENNIPTLKATVAYGPDGVTLNKNKVPVITNTYKAAEATAELTAFKTFTVNGNAVTLAKGQFEFTLTGENAKTPMPFGAENGVLTKANDAGGSVSFGSISYEKAGTYNYTIKEVTPTTGTTANGDKTLTGADGITYDTTAHTATVTVEDNGTGQLVATVVYDNDTAATAPVFANSQFKAEANIVADKHLYGSSEGSFQFTLVSTDSSYTERTGALTHYDASAQIVDNGQSFDVTVTNGEFSGGVATVTLPTISYTKPGTYYYLLGEVAGEGSMAYDASTYQIAVTVADNGSTTTQYAVVAEGEGAVALGEGEVPAFYNNAAVLTTFRSMSLASMRSEDAGVSVMPEVTKVLENGTLEAGEFTFTLTGTSENAKGIQLTATNDAAGNVAFATTDAITQEQSGALTFTEDTDIPYTFAITEVDDGQEMITYDKSPIGLTVTVTADESGALQATMTYYNADGTVTDEPTFNNEQNTVDLRVQKTSKSGGEPLVGARYGLWIYNENGNDVYLGNATSDEDGYMTFTNVDVREGERYYFKEEAAPEGHLVNPYRDPYFYFVYNEETGNYDVYYEGTAEYEEQFPDAL